MFVCLGYLLKMNSKRTTSEKAGQEVLIIRYTLETSKNLDFSLTRHQFPVKPAFAMTIHKSQGQTFEFVGIDLTYDVFAHGQLYFSRVKRLSALKTRLNPDRPSRTTKNIVYCEILMDDEENHAHTEENRNHDEENNRNTEVNARPLIEEEIKFRFMKDL
uniref:Uncharacterized protein n=1 Tax=Acrobeloides nanus TaxID=290746 RepID=A0A914DAM9_9BILA